MISKIWRYNMKVIFSKRQIEILKEENGEGGLNVLVPSISGNTAPIQDTLKQVSKAPEGLVDKLSIMNPKAKPQNGKPQVRAEVEADNPQNVTSDVQQKLQDISNKEGINGEIDLKQENFVRYSKKDLNEILFR